MAEFTVVWEIQIEADTAEEAARQAKATQAAPDTIADVYEVHAPDGKVEEIDLSALDGRSID
ncbi:hypothetical protein ACGF8D_10565 [Streptomyces massasporeus]|uniref:hypothetical protein n=1 Tax=Streptomyces massasporeus TaxID=67324 RepID=UPI00372467DA